MPLNNEKAFARQWFDYTNQIECNVYFSPFFTCRLSKQLKMKNLESYVENNLINTYILDDTQSAENQVIQKSSYKEDELLNETYSYKGLSFKTEDEFRIDTNPMKKSTITHSKETKQ